MDCTEREEGVYRIKARAALAAAGGYRAAVIIERERRGRTEEAYRNEHVDGERVFDEADAALSRAMDHAWQIIHRQPSRLAC
jgi:hypothetical protein